MFTHIPSQILTICHLNTNSAFEDLLRFHEDLL